MVTDPPYGVGYDPKWRLDAGVNKPWQKTAGGTVLNDDKADWTEAWALFPGDVAYVWHGGLHAATVQTSLQTAGFTVRAQIIWAKNSLVMGRGHYHWQHEPCWYAVRDKGTGHWAGDRKQSTIWQIANMHRTQGKVDDGKTVHGTQKPVECMRRPIENNSSAGQAVYEPFSGSGTTIIAGEMTGRSVHAIELNPAYVDVAVKRWQDFTGQTATLEAAGQTFADVCEQRFAADAARNGRECYDDAVNAARAKLEAAE
jgi:DNA modification methylase